MATTPWKQFHRWIQGELPECPIPTMDRALADAAIDLFTSSRSWRVAGLTTDTVADQQAYTIASGLPAESQLVGITSAWMNGEPMHELLPGQADEFDPACTYNERIAAAPPDGITLTPAPAVADKVVLFTGAFAPADDATGIPSQFWQTHHEAIERRAVAILRRSVGKAWSDPQAAQFAQSEYNRLALRVGTFAGPLNSLRPMLRVKPL